jgi:phosphoribosylanthranilate isomerase
MKDSPKIKICGMTRKEDALCALKNGADYIGFIFYAKSPRFISLDKAKEIIDFLHDNGYKKPKAIGVFVNETVKNVQLVSEKLNLFAVQLHGMENPEFCSSLSCKIIKVFRVKNAETLESIDEFNSWAILCDAYHPEKYGGTGERIDTSILKPHIKNHRIFLAGGLSPDNISDALKLIRPFAVDVSSGVEVSPGIKDHEKIKKFIKTVKNY